MTNAPGAECQELLAVSESGRAAYAAGCSDVRVERAAPGWFRRAPLVGSVLVVLLVLASASSLARHRLQPHLQGRPVEGLRLFQFRFPWESQSEQVDEDDDDDYADYEEDHYKDSRHSHSSHRRHRSDRSQHRHSHSHRAVAHHKELFCFVVMRRESQEQEVLERQASLHAGVFDCDDQMVFSDSPVTLASGLRTIAIGALNAAMGGQMTTSWVNTDGFLRAWEHIRNGRRYLGYDWTVKVDPDTVFIPSVLRMQLRARGPVGPVYLINCANVDDGFFGAVEVMSQLAARAYAENLDHCRATLPYKTGWGEDLFAQRCMSQAGVVGENNFNLVVDKNCDASVQLPDCAPGYPGYHPHKDPVDWEKCWRQASSHRPSSSPFQSLGPRRPGFLASGFGGPGFGARQGRERSVQRGAPEGDYDEYRHGEAWEHQSSFSPRFSPSLHKHPWPLAK